MHAVFSQSHATNNNMTDKMNYSLELIVFSLSILLLMLYVKFMNSASSNEREAPEADGAWPLVGHLHLLADGDQLPHHKLGAMADKYGPAFTIRLGTRRAFVVSSWEVAKECFTVNDLAFATRPQTAAVKHMCFDSSVFSLASYSPFWREMRKISVCEVLSNERVQMLKDVRSAELSLGISELFARWTENSQRQRQPAVVELNRWFEHMMLNIMVMTIVGKRYVGDSDEAARCRNAISEFFRLSGVFVLSDAIPFLWWLDLQGHEKQMKKTARDFDLVLGGWLNEHRQKRKLNIREGSKKDDVKDFIDVMLSLEDDGQLSNMEHDSDTSIKSTCMALILGGYHTTSMTLTWAISLLLNHPDVLKKLQKEIDDIVGKERVVDESDIKNLVFLEAIIKETLRLYPSAPLLGPREAMEECTVAGYKVKARTRLIINLWKLQRDERIWSDPSEFKPERFMGLDHQHLDLRGQHFVLVPFGYGRRSCPGATFALQVIHVVLARLVQSFDIGHPSGLSVDMTEGPGLTFPKKKPLEVILTPRLPSELYGH